MSIDDSFAAVDTFRYAFIQLQDDRSNHLDVLIAEGSVSAAKVEPLVIGDRKFERSQIEADGRTFLFRWPDYVAYLVTNECYSRTDPDEHYTGRVIRRYTRSQLLSYLAANKIANNDYPGPLIHLCLVSENHVVDVVSTELPEVVPGHWPPSASARRMKRSFQL